MCAMAALLIVSFVCVRWYFSNLNCSKWQNGKWNRNVILVYSIYLSLFVRLFLRKFIILFCYLFYVFFFSLILTTATKTFFVMTRIKWIFLFKISILFTFLIINTRKRERKRGTNTLYNYFARNCMMNKVLCSIGLKNQTSKE